MSSLSQAALRLELASQDLTPAQQTLSQQLLEQSAALLPPRFVEQLDLRVPVRWQQGMPSEVYAQVNAQRGISLNAELLAKLQAEPNAPAASGTAHTTRARSLQATLVHELMHLYDRARLWTPEQWRQHKRCQQQLKSTGKVGLTENCRGYSERRFTLSDDPQLLDLAGWPQRVGKHGQRQQRNDQVERSPDAYELSSPLEFVAVNFEYWLLDASYHCRRPLLAQYFSEHFAWQPSDEPCPSDLAYLNAGRDFARQPLGWIDPQRIYQVDYLLADANEQWMSRWGHSMLRLVICAPDRAVGPDCRLDLEHHLVLSYRAFVGDVQLSSWDGLTGVYPSRLFILPLEQVVDEYTKVELRSLFSVPLQLSRTQINSLVTRAAEQHWSYDGRYYFVSNNCAVETLKLLRSGAQDRRLQALESILPNGLLQLLGSRGLADLSVLDDQDQARRQGYLFDSLRQRYNAMFEIAQQRLALPYASAEDWLDLPAHTRQPYFEQADLRASAALLLLEEAALRRQQLLAQDELKRRYLGARDRTDSSSNAAGAALEELLASSGFLSRPAELLEHGYGLPQPSEWQALEDTAQSRQQHLHQLNTELEQQVRALLDPQRQAQLQGIEDNLEQLGLHLRALHRASDGLQLP